MIKVTFKQFVVTYAALLIAIAAFMAYYTQQSTVWGQPNTAAPHTSTMPPARTIMPLQADVTPLHEWWRIDLRHDLKSCVPDESSPLGWQQKYNNSQGGNYWHTGLTDNGSEVDLVDLGDVQEFGQERSTMERFFRSEAACQAVLPRVQKLYDAAKVDLLGELRKMGTNEDKYR
jgi:hypothetical protein